MKKILSFLLSIALVFSFMCIGVSAEGIKKGKIKVDTVTGVTGEEVFVPVYMSENPGIMAVTISFTYESDKLEFISLNRGAVFSSPTYAAHPDKNIIRYVICDIKNSTRNGIMTTLKFKVKEDAEFGLSEISVKYNMGDFCNYKIEKVMPEITAGGIDIAFNGKNCSHKKYGEWKVVSAPNCEDKGLQARVCEKCGHYDYRETDALGHEFSDKWTVDKPATPTTPGTMARYCIRCEEYVDQVVFEYKDTQKEDIKNEIWETVDEEIGNELFEEQNPGKELTENKPPVKDNGKGDAASGSSTENSSTESGDKSDSKPSDNSSVKEETDGNSSDNGDKNNKDSEKGDNKESENDEELSEKEEKIQEVINRDLPILNKIKSLFKVMFVTLVILFIM